MCFKLKAKTNANIVVDAEKSDSDDYIKDTPVAVITEECNIYNTSNTEHSLITVPVMLREIATPVDFQVVNGVDVLIKNKYQLVQLCGTSKP